MYVGPHASNDSEHTVVSEVVFNNYWQSFPFLSEECARST